MGLWYLSFVKVPEDVFLGGCVVNGRDPISATREASLLGCNPGGEVAAFDVTEFPNPFPVGKLMSRADMESIDGEPGLIFGDMSDDDMAIVDAHVQMIHDGWNKLMLGGK